MSPSALRFRRVLQRRGRAECLWPGRGEGHNPTYQSFGDSSLRSCRTARSTAASWSPAPPTTAITSLAASKPVYLVSLDDEHIDKLLADSPYYSKTTISKDTYNMPEDVTTVAVGAVVIARDDVSDADVYNFLYGIFENVDDTPPPTQGR